MTNGLTRRQGAQDSLEGRVENQPVILSGPGLQSPRPLNIQDNTSVQQRIANQLSEWSGAKFNTALNKQHEKDLLDGQMAYEQGVAFDQLETEGNKWAMEGYRLMDAQTLSSSFMAAQRQDIAMSGHALSPEEFRAQYVNRLDAQLEGKDPRTAELVRKQMGQQMPTLVADHTTSHMAYQEGEAYSALERSMDVVSRDPTASEQLVDFAKGGEGSPSAGLSDARRQSATVDGVIRAFDNDNPMAFATLSREGLLGDNLTTDQQNKIKAAQQRFENRRRSEYNEELFANEQELMGRVERGEVSPTDAIEELSTLYSAHGIEMTRAEAGAIYDQADTTSRQKAQSTGYLIEEAGLRGDTRTQASIIHDMLVGTESGGNSQAHRTNNDGRSFGGLVQFGQARLNETLDMMGRPRMSVAQFTALPPAQQKAIGIVHFQDLMSAAQATGMIGKQINGVTVTLSGAVAMAHLGGKGGMRKFLESNGAYDPADEEGTHLSDYLRKHASGELTELMPASEQLNRSRAMVNETRERLAMETYESSQKELAALDDQLLAGTLDKSTWQAARDIVRNDYNVAQTKANVNHEINTIRAADKANVADAKRQHDAAYKEATVQAEAALVAPRLAWEDVVNNPASTPEEIRAANAQYVETRRETYGSFGITTADQNRGAVSEEIITRTKSAIEAHNVWTGEQAEIDAAVNGRYLDRLPKNLQARAMDQEEERIVSAYTQAVAKGQMTEEQAQEGIATDMNAFFAQSGMVPQKVQMAMSAAVLDTLVDGEGNPNPRVIDAVEQYQSVKAQNPRAAKYMLDPEATLQAEAILSKAGANPGLIGEGVRAMGLSANKNPLSRTPEELAADTGLNNRITKSVDDYLDTREVGILHAIWQGDASLDQIFDNSASAADRLRSEETRVAVREALEQEVHELHAIAPNLSARDLVAHAGERLERRTELVGGDMVQLPLGGDFAENFFGQHATEFMGDGAINSAVVGWLASDAAKEQYPFIGGTNASEFIPQFLQDGINAAAGVVGLEFDPAMSHDDVKTTLMSGVRPFRSFLAPSGDIAVEVLMQNGSYSEPIVVPSKEAGDLYMQERRTQASN